MSFKDILHQHSWKYEDSDAPVRRECRCGAKERLAKIYKEIPAKDEMCWVPIK